MYYKCILQNAKEQTRADKKRSHTNLDFFSESKPRREISSWFLRFEIQSIWLYYYVSTF